MHAARLDFNRSDECAAVYWLECAVLHVPAIGPVFTVRVEFDTLQRRALLVTTAEVREGGRSSLLQNGVGCAFRLARQVTTLADLSARESTGAQATQQDGVVHPFTMKNGIAIRTVIPRLKVHGDLAAHPAYARRCGRRRVARSVRCQAMCWYAATDAPEAPHLPRFATPLVAMDVTTRGWRAHHVGITLTSMRRRSLRVSVAHVGAHAQYERRRVREARSPAPVKTSVLQPPAHGEHAPGCW